jgi:hypothetical protein
MLQLKACLPYWFCCIETVFSLVGQGGDNENVWKEDNPKSYDFSVSGRISILDNFLVYSAFAEKVLWIELVNIFSLKGSYWFY